MDPHNDFDKFDRANIEADESAFNRGFDAAIRALKIPSVNYQHPQYLADRRREYLKSRKHKPVTR